MGSYIDTCHAFITAPQSAMLLPTAAGAAAAAAGAAAVAHVVKVFQLPREANNDVDLCRWFIILKPWKCLSGLARLDAGVVSGTEVQGHACMMASTKCLRPRRPHCQK